MYYIHQNNIKIEGHFLLIHILHEIYLSDKRLNIGLYDKLILN